LSTLPINFIIQVSLSASSQDNYNIHH
jgi:hypothetical protein